MCCNCDLCRKSAKPVGQDIGYGETKNAPTKGAAFEKIKKEASTDALKRALKNFGSVLGNCLYDKSYVNKVTKIKSAPARWDVDDLHRHASISLPAKPESPIKKESLVNTSNANRLSTGTTLPNQSHTMPGRSKQEEDEFGGDDFDELDFINPDRVTVTETAALSKSAASMVSIVTDHSARDQRSETPSVAQMRQQLPNGNGAVQNGRPLNIPTKQHTGQGRPIQPPQRQQPPVHRQTNGAPGMQPNQRATSNGQQPQQAQNMTTTTSNPPNISNPQRPQSIPQNQNQPQSRPNPNPNPNAPPRQHEPTIGFYSARAAPLLSEDKPIPPNANIPQFNPHTPGQMRRTSGFNHSVSGPVLRQAVAATTTTTTGQNGVGPGSNVPVQDRPTNFVNPQADINRRIGMPGGGIPSPLANRTSAFKPPAIANGKRGPETQARPALLDVSNVRDGKGTDTLTKKPKLSEGDHATPDSGISKTT